MELVRRDFLIAVIFKFWITDKFERSECECPKDERDVDFLFLFIKKKKGRLVLVLF